MAKSEITFMLFNAENLFIYLDAAQASNIKEMTEEAWQKTSHSLHPNKSLKKIGQIVDAINSVKPDFILLNEVGGPSSLHNFNQYFLNSRYLPFIIPGNSDRGIDVGYLVSKELPITFDLRSHKDQPIEFTYPHERTNDKKKKSNLFSRDVLQLNAIDPQTQELKMIILLTHLKSKLDSDGIDYQGKLRRAAELKTLVKIYNDASQNLHVNMPVIVAGDFNGIANQKYCEPEFMYLHRNSNLLEIFDLLKAEENDRATQIQFFNNGGKIPLQLDYIFISPGLKRYLIREKTYVYKFKNEWDLPMDPQSLEERNKLPSDHYPVVATFTNFLF